MRPKGIALVLTLFMVLVLPWTSSAYTVTAPDNFFISNAMPFGQIGDVIYQQVYSSSFFSERINITGLDFFPATYIGSTDFVPADYAFLLSTTTRAVGALSTDLVSNLGCDTQLFFLGHLDGGSGVAGMPFTYDPELGNLLMMVTAINKADLGGGAAGGFWRAAADTGTSRAWYSFSDDTFHSDNVGLVTTFTYTPAPVPEPSTLLLLGSGLAGLSGLAWRRHRTSRDR